MGHSKGLGFAVESTGDLIPQGKFLFISLTGRYISGFAVESTGDLIPQGKFLFISITGRYIIASARNRWSSVKVVRTSSGPSLEASSEIRLSVSVAG